MLELRQIEKLADKQKWQKRFCAAYDGELKEWSDAVFGPNVKFYVACDGDKELGFVRINDKAQYFQSFTDGEVWNLTDAYVKPLYSSKGVLREMITQAVRDLNVKMLFIATDRFIANKAYYFALGFTYHYTVQDGGMTWAFQSSFASIVKASNEDCYRRSA